MMTSIRFRQGWRWILVVPVLLSLLGTGPGAPGVALAQNGASWNVKNRLQGKIKDDEIQKSEDVSGIACAPGALPRLCLVVDDESQGAQVVILAENLLVAGDFIRLVDDTYKGKPLELDAEGVAYADGFFYVVGSQGRARHETDATKEAKNAAKAVATRKIFRIGLSPDAVDLDSGTLKSQPSIVESAALASVLKSDPVLSPFFDVTLKDNGLTAEGIAVKGDRAYIALRGPIIETDKAVIADIPLAAIFDGQPGQATIHRLALGTDTRNDPRGIRDLIVQGDGFLLIAGPENDPKKDQIATGDYSIYAWDEKSATKLLDLPSYGKKNKPEALTVLSQDGNSLHALLMFDGAKEGMPTPIDITLP